MPREAPGGRRHTAAVHSATEQDPDHQAGDSKREDRLPVGEEVAQLEVEGRLVDQHGEQHGQFGCNGASAMELGAFTPFLWLLKVRDWVWDILERETGARMTHSFGRIGGMAEPPTVNFKEDVRQLIPEVHKVVKETEIMLLRNRIFLDRMQGVGVLTKEQALSYGVTGPVARSTGLAYDVRKDHPYMVYDRFDFDVPVGVGGDCYDRYLVRLEEMRLAMPKTPRRRMTTTLSMLILKK